MSDLKYPIVGTEQDIIIKENVLEHILEYRQLNTNDTEAGGQLFCSFEQSSVIISLATGPKEKDIRSRFRFIPNRLIERREIKKMHKAGMHFVGDWHTHPQAYPKPSIEDVGSMTDLYVRSEHQLGGMVMLIVGQADPPEGLHLSVCNSKSCIELWSI